MTEIIADPQFKTLEKPSSKWAVLNHQGVVMMPSVKSSVLYLDISKTSRANWHGELRYSPFPVTAGDTFTISFSVRAKHPFTFSVWLGQQNAPYQSLVSEQNHFGEKWMRPEWQTFTHTWQAIVNEENARLNFVLGQIDNSIEIKDVSLKKQ
jgi:hypothetical protein